MKTGAVTLFIASLLALNVSFCYGNKYIVRVAVNNLEKAKVIVGYSLKVVKTINMFSARYQTNISRANNFHLLVRDTNSYYITTSARYGMAGVNATAGSETVIFLILRDNTPSKMIVVFHFSAPSFIASSRFNSHCAHTVSALVYLCHNSNNLFASF